MLIKAGQNFVQDLITGDGCILGVGIDLQASRQVLPADLLTQEDILDRLDYG